jgi:hypothetical protein
MPIGRLVACVINISSYSKNLRKHAVIHSEVNVNVLNRYIFIVCNFRPVSPNRYNKLRFSFHSKRSLGIWRNSVSDFLTVKWGPTD